MIVKRNWSVSHCSREAMLLTVGSHETDAGKVVVSAIDPEMEPDDNLSFEMTIEELETLVKQARREYDHHKSLIEHDMAEAAKENSGG